MNATQKRRYGLPATVALILLGETVGILAEVYIARAAALNASLYLPFAMAFAAIAASGIMLVAGYMMGIRLLRNIWVVSVVSITSILIVEPIADYAIFLQLPTLGALIGFVLAAAGLLVNLLVK